MYNYKDKKHNIDMMNSYMLTKTLSMFEWEGLPETIPQRELEKLLQTKGYAFIAEHEGEVYAFHGGIGGKQDVYGHPTEIVISNPALGLNKTFNIKEDGLLIRNDDLQLGLMSFYEKQNSLLVENDINMNVWGINSRAQNLISAPDDKTKLSAETYLNKLHKGDLGVIGENVMFDGIRVHNSNGGSGVNVKSLLEYHQYIKSNLYNEVGLSSNFNMKKERLISSELEQAEDSLFPLVYNMMQNRLDSAEQFTEKFGIEISVDFGSVWFHKNKDLVDGEVSNEDSESLPPSDSQEPATVPSEPVDEERTEGTGEEEVVDAPESSTDSTEEVVEEEQGDSTTDEEKAPEDAPEDVTEDSEEESVEETPVEEDEPLDEPLEKLLDEEEEDEDGK